MRVCVCTQAHKASERARRTCCELVCDWASVHIAVPPLARVPAERYLQNTASDESHGECESRVTSGTRGYGGPHSRGNFSVRVSLAGIEPVGIFRFKSDLRNHQAIVQPRLYDTEGPHGLPSGRQTEADPLYPGLIILTVYDCGHAFQTLERSEPVRERIDSMEQPTI